MSDTLQKSPLGTPAFGWQRVASIALLTTFTASTAAADHIPLGGRTATMGGAAVAAGNDSAMPYLNPAGLAAVPAGVFGVSATLYSYRRLEIDDYFLPSGWGSDEDFGQLNTQRNVMASSTYVEMPSSVMYFGPSGDLGPRINYKLGVALVTPEVEHRELVGDFRATLPEVNGSLEERVGLSYRRNDYYVGPSVAFAVHDDLRLGLSAFAYYSRYHRVENFSYELLAAGGSSRGALAMTRASTGESLGLAPVAGLQFRVASQLWMGAGVTVPSIHLWGRRSSNGALDTSTPSDGGASVEQRVDTTASGDYRQDAPLRVTGGLAWEDRDVFSAALDVTYRAYRRDALWYPVTSEETVQVTGDITRRYTREQEPVEADLERTLDFSLGAELALSPMLALRFGGFTDLANTEELSPGRGDDWNRLRLDHYGGTLGLGLNTGSFDTTLGAVYARGKGRMGALDPENMGSEGQIVPVRAVQHSFFIVLSGTVTAAEGRSKIQETLGLEELPALPESDVRGLRYQPPPYGPRGLDASGKPSPMTPAEIEAALRGSDRPSPPEGDEPGNPAQDTQRRPAPPPAGQPGAAAPPEVPPAVEPVE